MMKCRIPLIIVTLCLYLAAHADGLSANQMAVTVDGKTFTVKVVCVPLNQYRVKVGLAQGHVGDTQSLAGIAKQDGAVAAINGSFFNAYTKSPLKPPYHHLFTGGEAAHIANNGTTLGFDADGNYRMDTVNFKLQGKTEGGSWYAYFMNRPADTTSAAILYTRFWTGERTPARGTQVLVQDNTVQCVSCDGQAMPQKGYVLLFAGGEEYLAKRFRAGASCSFRLAIEAEDTAFWGRVQEALGCGPRLVQAGNIAVNPRAEGFDDPKIMSLACQRSAVGVTRANELLLVTCPSATIRQLAGVMRELGAYDAMNLDGGASSALWYQGRYLTSPGRDISNALLILKR